MNSIPSSILNRMRADPGKVWTTSSFLDLGPRDRATVALHRLVKAGHVRRIDHGFYDVPRIGKLTKKPAPPDHMAVIAAVAQRDGARVILDGMAAANGCGFTNAVPANVTVLTDARIKPITVGNLKIVFQHVAARRLIWAGRPAANVVQALLWLRDTFETDGDAIARRLATILADPERGAAIRDDLEAGFRDLPLWLAPFVRNVLDGRHVAASSLVDVEDADDRKEVDDESVMKTPGMFS